MKEPTGREMLAYLIELLADQEGAIIEYEFVGDEEGEVQIAAPFNYKGTIYETRKRNSA